MADSSHLAPNTANHNYQPNPPSSRDPGTRPGDPIRRPRTYEEWAGLVMAAAATAGFGFYAFHLFIGMFGGVS